MPTVQVGKSRLTAWVDREPGITISELARKLAVETGDGSISC